MPDVFDYAEKQLPAKAYEELLFDSRMYSDTPQNRKVIDLIRQGKSVDEAFDLIYPQKQLTPEEEKALFDVDETDDSLGNDNDLWGPPRQQEPAQSAKPAPQEPEPAGAFQEYKKSRGQPPRKLFPLFPLRRRRRFFKR